MVWAAALGGAQACVATEGPADFGVFLEGMERAVVIPFVEDQATPLEAILVDATSQASIQSALRAMMPALHAKDTEVLHVVAFDARSFVDPDGVSLGEGPAWTERWAGLRPRLVLDGQRVVVPGEEGESGQCGRCLGLGPRPPATAYRGDACPLPAWVVHGNPVMDELDRFKIQVSDEARARAAGMLLLEWEGECDACTEELSADYSTKTSGEFRMVRGGWDAPDVPPGPSHPYFVEPFPFYHSACLPRDASGNEVCAWFSELAGVRSVQPSGGARAFDPIRRDREWPHFPQEAIERVFATRDRLFLVSIRNKFGRTAQAGQARRYLLFDERLEIVAQTSTPESVVVSPSLIRYLDLVEDDRTIYLSGLAEGGAFSDATPDVIACRVLAEVGVYQVRCASIASDAAKASLKQVRYVRRLSEGALTATASTYLWWGDEGLAFARPTADPIARWEWRIANWNAGIPFAEHAARSGRIEGVRLADDYVRVGDRVFLCGTGRVASSTIARTAFVMSATVSERLYGFAEPDGTPAVDWTVSAYGPDRDCRGFSVDGARVRSSLGEDLRVYMDRDGKVVETKKETPVREVKGIDRAYTAAFAVDDRLYAFNLRGATATHRRGGVERPICAVTAEKTCGQELPHACGCGVLTEWPGDPAEDPSDHDFEIVGSDECDQVRDAAADPTGRVVVVGASSPLCREYPSTAPKKRGFLRRLSGLGGDLGSTTLRYEPIEVPPALELPPDVAYTHVEAIGPDHFVVLAENEAIYRLVDGRLQQVAFEWVDPAVEGASAPNVRCGGRLPGDGSSGSPWRNLVAGNGYALAVGCSGTVVRIDRASATWFAPERGKWAGTDPSVGLELSRDDDLYAVRPICPDLAYLVSRRANNLEMWRMRPSEEPDPKRPGPLFEHFPRFSTNAPRSYSTPVELLGEGETSERPGSLMLLSRSANETWIHTLGAPEHLRIPTDSLRAVARTDRGRVMLGFGSDWFGVARNCSSLAPRLDELYAKLLRPRCATGGCHDLAAAGGLRLDEGREAALQALLAETRDPSAAAAFPRRVVPMEPDRSYFLHLIEGRDLPRHLLSECDSEAVRAWIAAGARSDG